MDILLLSYLIVMLIFCSDLASLAKWIFNAYFYTTNMYIIIHYIYLLLQCTYNAIVHYFISISWCNVLYTINSVSKSIHFYNWTILAWFSKAYAQNTVIILHISQILLLFSWSATVFVTSCDCRVAVMIWFLCCTILREVDK